jgi:hypothetical protein
MTESPRATFAARRPSWPAMAAVRQHLALLSLASECRTVVNCETRALIAVQQSLT